MLSVDFWHVIFFVREEVCEIFSEGREFHWYLLREDRIKAVI